MPLKKTDINLFRGYLKLWSVLNKRRKLQLTLLMFLMVLNSFAEMISLGAVIPFLSALIAPEKIIGSAIITSLPIQQNLLTIENIPSLMTIAFCCAVLFAGIVRLALLIVQTRTSHLIGVDIGYRIFTETLKQPLETHLRQNSSKAVATILLKVNSVVYQTILPVLTILNYSLLIFSIIVLLLLVQPTTAVIAVVAFGGLYAGTMFSIKNYLKNQSKTVNENQTKMVKTLNEGIGGIRHVLIDRSHKFFADLYLTTDLMMRKSVARIEILGGAPRPIVETIGIISIVLISFFLSKKVTSLVDFISFVALIAFAGQRLLPAFQQCYSAYTSIIGGRMQLFEALELMSLPETQVSTLEPATELRFTREISLNNVSFSYQQSSDIILSGVNITIIKGSRVGIIGKTGSGKSTLADIMMGLLCPTEGELLVDNRPINTKNCARWQKIISHVPQSIFISDSTIAENIAFGEHLKDIDHDRMKDAAKIAQIHDFIEGLENKYLSSIGEAGSLLSGGQAQRIGIARAIYKGAKVIFFDEATNALDVQTEKSVTSAITNLDDDITTISIAHRASILRDCDVIFEIKNNKVVRKR